MVDVLVSVLRSFCFGSMGIDEIQCAFSEQSCGCKGRGLQRGTVEACSYLGEAVRGLGRGSSSTHRQWKIWNCQDVERVWLAGSRKTGSKNEMKMRSMLSGPEWLSLALS